MTRNNGPDPSDWLLGSLQENTSAAGHACLTTIIADGTCAAELRDEDGIEWRAFRNLELEAQALADLL